MFCPRLEDGLSPLVSDLATRRVQLADLERGVQGKEQLLKSFQEKIEVSQAILRQVAGMAPCPNIYTSSSFSHKLEITTRKFMIRGF